MKKLSVAFVLIAFTVGGQMAMAADKKAVTAVNADEDCDGTSEAARSGVALTVQGNLSAKETPAPTCGASGSIPTEMAATVSSSSEPPKPLEDQKIKTKSNIKND